MSFKASPISYFLLYAILSLFFRFSLPHIRLSRTSSFAILLSGIAFDYLALTSHTVPQASCIYYLKSNNTPYAKSTLSKPLHSRLERGTFVTADVPFGSALPLQRKHIMDAPNSGRISFVTMSRSCFLLLGLSVSPATPSTKSSGLMNNLVLSINFGWDKRATTFCVRVSIWEGGLSDARHLRVGSGCESVGKLRKLSL